MMKKKIDRNLKKYNKLGHKRHLLRLKQFELAQLLDIEEMKERNKHGSSK